MGENDAKSRKVRYYYYRTIFSILIQTSEKDTANHILEFEIK